MQRFSDSKIQKKISGPLLDRIDIHIEVPQLKYEHLTAKKEEEPSCKIRERVQRARKIQLERFRDTGIYFNSQMGHKVFKRFCILDKEAETLLEMAVRELNFSARSYDRILKVSRTVADLANSEIIASEHISEAIQYRSLDRDLF
jgi:magnesium chelatase family protein